MSPKSLRQHKQDPEKKCPKRNSSVCHVAPEAKEVVVNVKLTPSNIKHLDAIRARLAKRGKGEISRNDLIRIAITLLTDEDV